MKKNNLKSNLSEHLKEQPTSSFSKNVMQQIQEEVFLKSELKVGLIQKAPVNFAASVLKECLPNSVVENYEPVISEKAWYVISFVLTILMLFSFRNSNPSATGKYIDSITGVFSSKLNLILQSSLSNDFLMMMVISISCLILFDNLLILRKSFFKSI